MKGKEIDKPRCVCGVKLASLVLHWSNNATNNKKPISKFSTGHAVCVNYIADIIA